MDNDDLFAVEETSASQPATTTEVPAQAAEPTPSAPIETDLTPNAEQQAVLDRIRDASKNAGTFQLQNGRVVVAKSERTPEPQAQQQQPATPAQQSEQMVELNWRGQIVQKPISEVRNLAQKGFDYEAKNFEINQQRQYLAQKERELEKLMQTTQGIVQQQPTELSDEDIAQRAMSLVKDKFGKDDPSFEFDPLSPEQTALFNMAVMRLAKASEDQKAQMEAVAQEEQTRDLRMTSWEQAQKTSDPQYDAVIQWVVEPVGYDATNNPVPRIKQILTAEQYAVADQAFRTGDTATLSKIVTFCKAKYQQQKLGLPTKPQTVAVPVVQTPGNGQQPQQQSAAAKTWPKSEHNIPQEQRIELWKARFAKR